MMATCDIQVETNPVQRWKLANRLLVFATLAIVSLSRITAAPPKETESSLAQNDRQVKELLIAGIDEGEMAGAVVMATQGGEFRCAIAVGDAQVQPIRRPMELDTVFDLASLTKPIATATAIMKLAQQTQLRLDDRVAHHWPEFAKEGKAAITIADLLLHQGGLIADNALGDYSEDQEANWQRIANLKPIAPPGEKFVYSDVGFLVLGRVIEHVSGQTLDEFCLRHVFSPLEMNETGFIPPASLRRRSAATERRGGEWLVGEVHDPRAARMQGVAGHAGLFSTAADLIRYGEALLDREHLDQGPLFPTAIRDQMILPRDVPGGHQRAYGWDIRSSYSSNRPETFSPRAFGHGGFTGTVLWIDPGEQRVFVFLSNRLHPDGSGSVNRLAAQVADAILW